MCHAKFTTPRPHFGQRFICRILVSIVSSFVEIRELYNAVVRGGMGNGGYDWGTKLDTMSTQMVRLGM